MLDRMMNINDVVNVTGISRATIYRQMEAGEFPQRVRISGGRVSWRESEIQEWIRLGADQWRALRDKNHTKEA
ncbi:helix-turn-helix transcriptional regulator [Marinobacterium sediminicola]|uniref:Transcriptional regulator, AlpA family n=1 Tax=Marinobacterium sediminicola TaxID=518898 RepID=A0ABY1S3A3_9GAMM|nr:AlpA family phage regulatory protein [Marinobacterium sediminicola]ULG68837.1 AlpA family phage regulatory protein [Marinobacterium sediminicola]SMR77553.1 transcriptional regulator, AlpA family [Marinobacterium sediminicola]